MNPERVFRILWGPSLENALDFAFPVVGEAPTFSRRPRAGSTMVSTGASAVAIITGRHYRLKVNAKYFGGQQNFGATGLQAFIDWAADSNAFTLMPNIALPTLTVTGCYLEGPFTQLNPSQEQDSTQTLPLTILHPTVDLGIAWRGLFFEYVAGQSLTDPTRLTYSRSSVGYEITPGGYLLSHPTDSVCDGHYPDRVGGLQTALFEPSVANDITFPEDLSNAAWDKTNNVTVTANNAKAPDQASTADLVVETVTNGIHCIASNAITIVSADVQTALFFVRDGGRYKGAVYFGDGIGAAATNRFGVSWDLLAGTIAATQNLGAGTLAASQIIPLAGGWYMIWIRGAINGGATTSFLNFRLFDAGGAGSYAGDAASGTYFWGATAVHGVNNFVASYTPTSATKDVLKTLLSAVTPQTAQFIYIQAVEAGAVLAAAAQFPALLTIGSFGAVWRTIIDINNGTANRYSVNNGNNVGSVTASATAAPTVGQMFELLVLIYPDQSVKIIQSIAGGAEAASAQTGAPSVAAPAAYPTSGGFNTYFSNSDGAGYGSDVHQIARVKIGAFVTTGPFSVATIAQARYT